MLSNKCCELVLYSEICSTFAESYQMKHCTYSVHDFAQWVGAGSMCHPRSAGIVFEKLKITKLNGTFNITMHNSI